MEDWTIVVSPDSDVMACSPDGLDIPARLGYEFKTKDYVRVPQLPTDLLACEYLQCQTCLAFCRDFIDAWVICYHRLDTNEFRAYRITFDSVLWEQTVWPALCEFTDRVSTVSAQLMEASLAGDVVFHDFMNKHKYGNMPTGSRGATMDTLRHSMHMHVNRVSLVQ